MHGHDARVARPADGWLWRPLEVEPRRVRPPYELLDPTRVQVFDAESTEQWRARMHWDNLKALHEPLPGIELGLQERRILDWLAGRDIPTIGTVTCLLHRARAARPAPIHLAGGAE